MHYMRTLDWDFVLYNCFISGTERDFIYYDHFRGLFVNYWIWWIRKVVLETRDILYSNDKKKGRYVHNFMLASQYKSGENTETHIHIVSSWLQVIYILWIFYVSILSICHRFIDSSIFGSDS